MSPNIEKKMPNGKNLFLTSFLKGCVELINSKYDINMCLYQPGLEPLSLIGKPEQKILAELHNNIVIMLSKLNASGNISLSSWAFKSFLGFEKEELKKVSARLVALFPVTQLKDETFEKQLIAIEATNYVNDILIDISQAMLTSYIKEYAVLLEDLKGFTSNTEKITETATITMTAPQSLSNYFRIMYKDKSDCYCTIADALRNNQVQTK